jgi:hypothetical protein
VASGALEQSALEAKDREQLVAIAGAKKYKILLAVDFSAIKTKVKTFVLNSIALM